MFTALSHNGDESLVDPTIDEVLFVRGFDIPLEQSAAYNTVAERLRFFASSLSATLIQVHTNLRQTRFNQAEWGALSHGPALAGIALLLENRYSRVLIPSTNDLAHLVPLGSHPVTNPLFSSTRLAIIHDGAAYTRVEKTERIARSHNALHALRVCYVSSSDTNCSKCEKCYRTMITLSLYGALERAVLFDPKRYDVCKIPNIYLRSDANEVLLREVCALARELGRTDIAAHISASVVRSRRLRNIMSLVDRLPLLRRTIRRMILRNALQ